MFLRTASLWPAMNSGVLKDSVIHTCICCWFLSFFIIIIIVLFKKKNMPLFVFGVLCNRAKHNSRETVQSAPACIFHQPNLPVSGRPSGSIGMMKRIVQALANMGKRRTPPTEPSSFIRSSWALCKMFLTSWLFVCLFAAMLNAREPESQAKDAEVDGWCVYMGMGDNNPSLIDSGRIACRQEAARRRLCECQRNLIQLPDKVHFFPLPLVSLYSIKQRGCETNDTRGF